MLNGRVQVPDPSNEVVKFYAPGSLERRSLKHRLQQMLAERIEIPLIIGGEEVRTERTFQTVCPHDHGSVLATVHQAGETEVHRAIDAARAAWKEWSETDWEARVAVFLKGADLLAGPWRDTLNAATMLDQSKTVYQAEVDSACELIDFWRFNSYFAQQIYGEQPRSQAGIWNRLEHRSLEGFVFAVSPFNFTSIAGNLPTAPAMMGNTALWKPASTAPLAAYYIMKLLEEAGLPPGVINFVPGRGGEVGDPALRSEYLAGIHFTGSTPTFQSMWRTVGENIGGYRSYPRIVGETGGKGFIFAHPTADRLSLTTALVRGSFEYQGQKCSAASRAYIPKSLWSSLKPDLVEQVAGISMGSPLDFRNFMAAVIDEKAFDNTMEYIAHASGSTAMEIICGGTGSKESGYFVSPTVVVSDDPKSRLMCEEIFAPVLTIHVYEDAQIEAALDWCDSTSPYALTGAVFARGRDDIVHLSNRLRHSAGNFYINDKPTGAVVGQQPFGGGRASGTNDKAGSTLNLSRWTSQRTIKETFVPAVNYPYPHMEEE